MMWIRISEYKVFAGRITKIYPQEMLKISTETTDENDKTNCTYSKDWSNNLIDSSEFKQGGHQNPTSFKFEGEDFLASNVKVGAFEMPQRLLEKLSYNKDLKNEEKKKERERKRVRNRRR